MNSFAIFFVLASLPFGASFSQHEDSLHFFHGREHLPIRRQRVIREVYRRKSDLNPVPKKKAKGPFEKRPTNEMKRKSKHENYFISKAVSLKSQLDYARNGHAVLRSFIHPKSLQAIRKDVIKYAKEEELKAWKQKVEVALNSVEQAKSLKTVEECEHQLENLGITEIPFLQFFNSWTSLPKVKNLVYALGESAAVFLDVPSVRLYQDSIFWKRSVDGPTPWHVDARMAPFDTSHFITFWIPLNDVPASGTALMFCSKSHSDFALPYWSPLSGDDTGAQSSTSEWNRLEQRYPRKDVHYMPMKMGDVTVHSGWTLHCANENNNSVDRLALAVSFVDAKAEIRPDALDDIGKGDNEDLNSYSTWVNEVSPKSQFQHKLVPIVWPR